MPGDRVVVDGLWRCLCPSIDLLSLSRPFDLRLLRTRPRPILPHTQCQRYHERAQPYQAKQVKSRHSSLHPRLSYLNRIGGRHPWLAEALSDDGNSLTARLRNVPTIEIYSALKEVQDAEDTYRFVVRLVEYLVKERGERPNAALYASLIKANVSTRYGSARVAGQLFKEMQTRRIPATPDAYQALLEVTAVHPDYVLRSHVLHEMKNRWYEITQSAEISIIIGLLRDAQYELALHKLEAMNKEPENVPLWLLDMFLYIYGSLGFHAETLAILKYRLSRPVSGADRTRTNLSLNAWQYLLEVFSRDSFQPGIKYIWDHYVTHDYSHPPDGVLLKVLNTASSYGDATLAMSAVQMLSARGVKLDLHHYEPLINAHVQQADLHRAFLILCVMAKAGLSPDLSSTRPIFQMLRSSPASKELAHSILHELKLHHTVPAVAFNVLLEATVELDGFSAACDLYRTVRQVCKSGPDQATYEILLRNCTEQRSMRFLMYEMEALSLKPTRIVYDHLVRICALQDDYESAFQYLAAMTNSTPASSSETWWVGRSSALALLRRCIQARDPRTQSFLDACRRRRLFDDDDIKSLMSNETATSSNAEALSPPREFSAEEKGVESAASPLSGAVSV
ncbi:hypothetical protein GGS20DRAFT_409926 [Poronia punctata]|nr:hypothetical protein GGS20DRAFT_409926 [Poronia punctata]